MGFVWYHSRTNPDGWQFDNLVHSVHSLIPCSSSDPADLTCLSPNHLLLLRESPCLPSGVFSKEDHYVQCRWRQVQYMSDLFWKIGSVNICLPCRSARSGYFLIAMFKSVMRSWWSIPALLEDYGLLAGCRLCFQTRRFSPQCGS